MGEAEEVYIGNGVTVNKPVADKMRVLDVQKACEIFTENKGKEAYLGMDQDWYFTAEQVGSCEDIKDFSLKASCWDKPCMEIDGVKQDCYVEVDKDVYHTVHNYGFKSATDKLDFWAKDFVSRVRALEYDDIKWFFLNAEAMLKECEDGRKADD